MKPMPKKKRLLLQKTLREQIAQIREMLSSLLSRGMSTEVSRTDKVRLPKKARTEKERRWRRKL